MTTIDVTNRSSGHDAKRLGERLVRDRRCPATCRTVS